MTRYDMGKARAKAVGTIVCAAKNVIDTNDFFDPWVKEDGKRDYRFLQILI